MQKPTCHRFHRLMHVETVHRPPLVSWLLPFSPQAVISVLWKPLPQASLSSWGYSTLAVGLLNSGQASLFNLCDLKTNSWQSVWSFFELWLVFNPIKWLHIPGSGGILSARLPTFIPISPKHMSLLRLHSGMEPSEAHPSYLVDKAGLHPGQIT